MENELTIDQTIEKVERYINQLLPLPTCPEKKVKTEWKREQVKLRLSGKSKQVGPSEIKY